MAKYIFNEDYKNLDSEELWSKITAYIIHSKEIVTATGHSYEAQLNNDFIQYRTEKRTDKTETISKRQILKTIDLLKEKEKLSISLIKEYLERDLKALHSKFAQLTAILISTQIIERSQEQEAESR